MGDSLEAAPPGWEKPGQTEQSPPPPPPPPPLTPPPLPSPPPINKDAEMGQMVCGNCRELLSYPKGAIHVQCNCCQTVNFVLEAHQVGNVKCGKCSVLLMYPFGAPAVKCSSCHFVTEIGAHNIRPPVCVQQGQPFPLQNEAH